MVITPALRSASMLFCSGVCALLPIAPPSALAVQYESVP